MCLAGFSYGWDGEGGFGVSISMLLGRRLRIEGEWNGWSYVLKDEERGGVDRNGAERNRAEQSGTERNRAERSGTERNGAERSGTERNEEISMEIRHIWHDWYSKTWLKNDKKEPPKKDKNLHFIVLLIFLQTSFPFFFSDMITMIKVIFQMDEFYKKMLTTIRSTLETRFPL